MLVEVVQEEEETKLSQNRQELHWDHGGKSFSANPSCPLEDMVNV